MNRALPPIFVGFMLPSRAAMFLCIVASLLVTGCDPVRTTLQPVRVRVVDSAAERPVAAAQVSLKVDYPTAEPMPKEWHMTPEEWEKYKRENWEQRPWFRNATDKDGRADVEVKYTVLDRTWGSKPPAWRDWVTGKPYLIRIKAGEVPEEEMSVVMNPGAVVKGKSCTVTIVDIQQPKYVPTR